MDYVQNENNAIKIGDKYSLLASGILNLVEKVSIITMCVEYIVESKQ